jgi:hypothetical protein
MKKRYFFISLIIIGAIFYRKVMVMGMIFFGAIFFPEASKILKHYCFGNGEKMILQSDYIKNSPVIQKKIKEMNVGEKRKVTLKQWEDWRLSYALNPFYIEKRKDKAIITQYIQFDDTDRDYTWFGPFRIKDNIVHTFDCKAFQLYHEFKF